MAVGGVAEAQITHGQRATERGGGERRVVRRFGFARDGEDLVQAGDGHGGFSQLGEDAAHLADRPEHDAEVGEEGE